MSARVVSRLGEMHGSEVYSRIGVITFYAAQVSLIKRSLRKVGVAHDDNSSEGNASAFTDGAVKVMSVDGYQGSEADIIIISFVRCNASSNVGFVNDFQRLNVSLTRAKHALILIGCTKTLENSGSVDLKHLVSDARDRNVIIPDSTLLEHIA